jgi:hypothetical protein
MWCCGVESIQILCTFEQLLVGAMLMSYNFSTLINDIQRQVVHFRVSARARARARARRALSKMLGLGLGSKARRARASVLISKII